MNNQEIINDIIEARNGHYIHAIEVTSKYDLECVIEQFYYEFIERYELEDIISFFNTISIYCLEDEHEHEVYNFDITKFINELN
jgi:hypothetical protein